MGKKQEQVAKARIAVQRGGERWSLLSVKRAEGKAKHGKLEMLGGHLDGDESPIEALIRELREEEETGLLSEKVSAELPPHVSIDVAGALHHVFWFDVDNGDLAHLQYSPEESLGFELVLTSELEAGEHRHRLTSRTRQVLEALQHPRKKES